MTLAPRHDGRPPQGDSFGGLHGGGEQHRVAARCLRVDVAAEHGAHSSGLAAAPLLKTSAAPTQYQLTSPLVRRCRSRRSSSRWSRSAFSRR